MNFESHRDRGLGSRGLGVYRDHGKENGNYCSIIGYRMWLRVLGF